MKAEARYNGFLVARQSLLGWLSGLDTRIGAKTTLSLVGRRKFDRKEVCARLQHCLMPNGARRNNNLCGNRRHFTIRPGRVLHWRQASVIRILRDAPCTLRHYSGLPGLFLWKACCGIMKASLSRSGTTTYAQTVANFF